MKLKFKYKNYWPLALITLSALVIRLYKLTAISLWHDEAFSALLVRYSWSEMIYRIGLDVHPPMYYIFLRFWHYLFGDSLWSLRGFSVLFGIALIPLTFLLIKEVFKNQKAAYIGAALIALNPFQIQYVTEARMYTMGAFFGLLCAYLLVKALHEQKQYWEDKKLNMPNLPQDIALKRRSIIYYVLFSLTALICILTHYYLLFTVAAICLYGLIYHLRYFQGELKRYVWLTISYILIILGFLPWLKTFIYQVRQVGAGYWIPAMDKWSIPTTLWQLLIGWNNDIKQTQTQILVGGVSVLVITFIFWFLKKSNFFEKWLLALAFIAPFGGSIVFYVLAQLNGSKSSVFLVRYFLFASPFLIIMLGLWLEKIKLKSLGIGLAILLAVINLYTVIHFWDDLNVKSKPGMAAAARYLNQNVGPEDKLYIGSTFEFFNFKYYNDSGVRPLLFTGGRASISQMSHVEGTAILTDEDLIPDFKKDVKQGDTVWLVWTNGFGSSKPAVPGTWVMIDEKAYAEVRPYVGTYIYVDQYKVN